MIECHGSPTTVIDDVTLCNIVTNAIQKMGNNFKNILLLPPDYTRYHSKAGPITNALYEIYKVYTISL